MSDDEWGRDPSVQGMRRVFAAMEESQGGLLGALALSPLDRRLRGWREDALDLFERTWGRAADRGHRLGERQLADLYGACFAAVLERAAISIPPAALPSDGAINRLVRELVP